MVARRIRSDHSELHGNYRAPQFRLGAKVNCQVRDELTIVGMTDAPIPWPLGTNGPGPRSLIVYGDLVRAIRRESVSAMCHWFGVNYQTVTKWRKALGVPERNYGTRKLWEARLAAGSYVNGLRAAERKTRDPIAVAKRAAAIRGQPRPPHVVEAVSRAHKGKRLSAEARQKMREAWKRRRKGRRKPTGGYWKPWEDKLLGAASISEVMCLTGRTRGAVQWRKRLLASENKGDRPASSGDTSMPTGFPKYHVDPANASFHPHGRPRGRSRAQRLSQ